MICWAASSSFHSSLVKSTSTSLKVTRICNTKHTCTMPDAHLCPPFPRSQQERLETEHKPELTEKVRSILLDGQTLSTYYPKLRSTLCFRFRSARCIFTQIKLILNCPGKENRYQNLLHVYSTPHSRQENWGEVDKYYLKFKTLHWSRYYDKIIKNIFSQKWRNQKIIL